MTLYRGWISVRPVLPINKAHVQLMECSRLNLESGDNVMVKTMAASTPIIQDIIKTLGVDTQPVWLVIQVIVNLDGKMREGFVRFSSPEVADPDTELRIPDINITWAK
jgi:hypothetical protein